MPLTGPAARQLRALAHALSPVVHVGKHGVNDDVAAAVSRALLDHELIKVKVQGEAPESADEVGAALAARCMADIAQRIGRIVVLYKPHPRKQTIPIPKGYTRPAKVAAKVADPDAPGDASHLTHGDG